MKQYLTLILTAFFIFGCGGENSSPSSTDNSKYSLSSSSVRFAFMGDTLYTIKDGEMTLYDVSEAQRAVLMTRVSVEKNVTTLFTNSNHLYIGSDDTLKVYDAQLPTLPKDIGTISFTQSCGNLLIQDDLLYLTLNSHCKEQANTLNELRIFSLKNPAKLEEITRVGMYEPTAIAIDKEKLFVCDGRAGLKLFDVNVSEVNQTINVKLERKDVEFDVNCTQMLADDNILVVTTPNGVKEYDYSAGFTLQQNSIIK